MRDLLWQPQYKREGFCPCFLSITSLLTGNQQGKPKPCCKGLGFRVKVLGFRVNVLGFRVKVLGFRV